MKKCFVLSPIGPDGSETRKRADTFLRHIIKPVCEAKSYEVMRADEIPDPGSITSQVIQQIYNADLVIADLTDRNPNVFYELAIRHALAKPYIHIIEKGELIPFDISTERTIFIDLKDLDSAADARLQIEKQIDAINRPGFTLETPVKFALDKFEWKSSNEPELQKFSEIYDTLEQMNRTLKSIHKNNVQSTVTIGDADHFEIKTCIDHVETLISHIHETLNDSEPDYPDMLVTLRFSFTLLSELKNRLDRLRFKHIPF